METAPRRSRVVKFGVFEVDLQAGELRKSGIRQKLVGQPFQVLQILLEHPQEVVTREELRQRIWSNHTFIDHDLALKKAVNRIRDALGDSAESPRFIETLPRRGYRFIPPVTGVDGTTRGTAAGVSAAARPSSRKIVVTVAVVVVLVAGIAGGLLLRTRRARHLTEKDTIVLADFANSTGDAVFDDTLRQALTVDLEQSPFLNILPDRKVAATLKLMGRSPDQPLTANIARDLCQRVGGKAMLAGSIASLGNQYVIGLKATNCATGDSLGAEQVRAEGKEKVLKALDNAASSLRRKLGESISSVQKYATRLEQATTPSLEALKAYSLGRKMFYEKGSTAALPFFKRAVELDPNFAMAYRSMWAMYANRKEGGRAFENLHKAYELREKVSERERFYIEANYYMDGTGELEKAVAAYELWRQTYPRDFGVYLYLRAIDRGLGNLEKSLEEAREALRLEPNYVINYVNLGSGYMILNRLDEAAAVYKQAEERKLEGEIFLLRGRYELAFLKDDTAQMAQLVSAALGKPGTEDVLLAEQADTEAWYGKMKTARELTRRAMNSAQHNDAKEAAAAYEAEAALREVESGNREKARADADAAMKLAPYRDVRTGDVRTMVELALARARAGDTAAAKKLAHELDKTYPLDPLVQRYWLPTIRAAVALQRKDPNRAIELLQVASAIELGDEGNLLPVYLRGEAYLRLHDGNRAAAEFQKFIDYRGLVGNCPLGALARLGMARAYALQGDTANARGAYQDFLTLWKDADPDIPILKQAKTEYAKLK